MNYDRRKHKEGTTEIPKKKKNEDWHLPNKEDEEMVEEERKKRETKENGREKEVNRQRETHEDIERLFLATMKRGWRKRIAKCRGIGNRCLAEGVGFGRHGDKQPPGPSQLVAGVGRKGWPRASAGQVRLSTQPECHSVQGNTRMSFGRDGE